MKMTLRTQQMKLSSLQRLNKSYKTQVRNILFPDQIERMTPSDYEATVSRCDTSSPCWSLLHCSHQDRDICLKHHLNFNPLVSQQRWLLHPLIPPIIILIMTILLLSPHLHQRNLPSP